jgi:hypothetical protein
MYGFSPVCVLSLDDQANNFEHLGQEWGVLPEWTLKCLCKLEESIEIFIQRELGNFMYRRPILCTLYGAVDFLNVLKKYIMYV